MIVRVILDIEVDEGWVDAFYPLTGTDVARWTQEHSRSAIEQWTDTYSPLPGAPRLVSLYAEEES